MPRIRNVGDLDWQEPMRGRNTIFTRKDCINVRLLLDKKIGAPTIISPEKVLYAMGANLSFTIDSERDIIAEENTRYLPSLAREIGRKFSLEKDIPEVEVSLCDPHLKRIEYRLGVGDVFESFRFPTKFIESLARRVNKWVKEWEY